MCVCLTGGVTLLFTCNADLGAEDVVLAQHPIKVIQGNLMTAGDVGEVGCCSLRGAGRRPLRIQGIHLSSGQIPDGEFLQGQPSGSQTRLLNHCYQLLARHSYCNLMRSRTESLYSACVSKVCTKSQSGTIPVVHKQGISIKLPSCKHTNITGIFTWR